MDKETALSLVALTSLFFGPVFLFLGLRAYIISHNSANWPQTIGSVTHRNVQNSGDTNERGLYLSIRYKYSVDLEAYNIAVELGKNILSLETIEEQIKVLENLSHEKILDFLKRIGNWDAYAKEYVKCYLAGDLIKLKSNAIGFPSRHSSVIDRRDKILYERMLVHLEIGNTVAFVGAPHIRGISEMLRSEGYQTRTEHS